MHHCFVEEKDIIKDIIKIRDEELRHIRDVLHIKSGEEISISDGIGNDYICSLEKIINDEAIFRIISKKISQNELKSKITLYQALPKLDKMELIIQKSVELGIYKIVPIVTNRCIVRLDNKKADNKIKRWQEISKAAAKQSKRNIIPLISKVLDFDSALRASNECEHKFLAYENKKGIKNTLELINKIGLNEKIAIFIGPEGGFCDSEIELALKNNINIISLGNRILRTESAALCLLSNIMFYLEGLDE